MECRSRDVNKVLICSRTFGRKRLSAIEPQSVHCSQYELDGKENALRSRLASLGSVRVAYSGGTDSAFLAWAARKVLGERMLAVLAESPSLPRGELKLAMDFVEHRKIPLKVITTEELERTEYLRNDASRCFYCKDELFTLMEREQDALGFAHITYGKNVDDDRDFRP
jgi:pyridinium-3,5-biscarboxylic acid mononucleotide sulfurtransferase